MKHNFLHQFLLQSSSNYNKIAVITSETTVNYGELNQMVYNFSRFMNLEGVLPGDRIILELSPTPEAIAMMLAVSMSGGAFIFISPLLPENRKKVIQDLTKPIIWITRDVNQKEKSKVTSLLLKERELHLLHKNNHTDSRTLLPNQPANLAYIVFTSGSTGIPKGIMMTHGSVLSFYEGIGDLTVHQNSVLGSAAPFQFDFSLIDIGVALSNGATLVIIPPLLVHYPKKLVQFLNRNKVTQVQGVPSIWMELIVNESQLIKELETLENIVYGGENFSINHIQKIIDEKPNMRFIQLFGHSESVACSFREFKSPIPSLNGKIPIGKGFHNLKMSIVDDDNQEITESFKKGIIQIEGSCVFFGYLKDQEATDQTLFVRDEDSSKRIFKSGDIAYKDDNGEFYFVGRNDDQIKVLGNRVELQEIENTLMKHQDIANANVLFDQKIIAFVWAQKDKELKISELKKHCAEILPSYMLPSQFIIKKDFSLTINGKINKKKLFE